MNLELLNIPEKKISQLKKKGIETIEDVTHMFPNKYIDYRNPKNLNNAVSGERCSMILYIMEVKKREKYVEAVCREEETRGDVKVKWFFQDYKYNEIYNLYKMHATVCGFFTKDPTFGCSFNNPDLFTTDVEGGLCIYPVYGKIKGMSDIYFSDIINKAIDIYKQNINDRFSADIRDYFKIEDECTMLNLMHHPKTVNDIFRGNKRLVFETLYDFAEKMIKSSEGIQKLSNIIPTKLMNCNKLIKELPYMLTDDQKKIVKTFMEQARSGKRVNALIQGDVGCGKTVCAFLLMFAMSDNGYQSALMAPTGVLARQHYEELTKYAEKFGLKTVYLSGDLKAKEKKEALEKIKDGTANFIVSTHAVLSDKVEFKNLGLTIVDEEHKFGVVQREILKKKADMGVHSISMSATPIPRSLALTLYGDALDIYTIESMPSGRKPVKTAVVNDNLSAFTFMEHEIKKGHQCYIVCPLISDENLINADDDTEIESVMSVYKKTEDFFGIKGIKSAVITGKMKDEEKNSIIDSFAKNETQILIATTIIEVGVNVPNATVMTIMEADRFGLAGLHQLRGRVGRSDIQSYCLLKSTKQNNDRLMAMCRTNNGFEIAEEDLKLRGTGEFTGTRQSGEDRNVRLMLKNPKFYQDIKEYIKNNRADTLAI